MQYKIPVQIENDDPIFLGLGLKQLVIIMIGGGLAWSLFENLAQVTGKEVAAIPSILIAIITLLIAKFKIAEMTFVQFILSFIRLKSNLEQRKWIKGVDSFSPIDIGYVNTHEKKKEDNIDFSSKIEQIKELENNINKI